MPGCACRSIFQRSDVREGSHLMPDALPAIKRKGTGVSKLVMVLAALAVVLAGVAGYLIFTQVLSPNQPKSINDRDIELLETQLKKTPNEPTILARLAELQYQAGRKTEALQYAERAVKYAGETPLVRLHVAGIYLQEKRPADAKKLAEAELELDETSSKAEAYFILGQAERDLGNTEEALDAMNEGVTLNPTSADARVLFAQMLVKAGHKEDAITQYQQALQFMPDDQEISEALRSLGVTPTVDADSNPHASTAATDTK